MILSAYCVNNLGLLVYAGLPVMSTVLTFADHNGQYKHPVGGRQYEIVATGEFGFQHGHPIAKRMGVQYLLDGNCWRCFEK